MEVQTQWRISFGGLVGLDMTAVSTIADILGIELTPPTYKILKGLELHILQQQRTKQQD